MGRLTPGILTEYRKRALGENDMERHYLGKDLGAFWSAHCTVYFYNNLWNREDNDDPYFIGEDADLDLERIPGGNHISWGAVGFGIPTHYLV